MDDAAEAACRTHDGLGCSDVGWSCSGRERGRCSGCDRTPSARVQRAAADEYSKHLIVEHQWSDGFEKNVRIAQESFGRVDLRHAIRCHLQTICDTAG